MALMAVFAFVSEVPFDLAGNRQWFDMRSQNVYFTLFLGLTACYVVRLLKENGKNIFLSIPITALLCASAFVLSTDYSWYGVLLIWLFAVSEEWPQRIRIPLLVLGLLLIGRPWNMIADGFAPSAVNTFLLQFAGSLFALVLILNYNGKRGNLRVNKYFFYAYYPAHLLLFGLAANYMF